MSRSYLKSKFMRGESVRYMSQKIPRCAWTGNRKRNPHHLDEMPRNRPSRYIQVRCGEKVEWVQQHSTAWGHRPARNGHSRISGIVRQKVKEEVRQEIQDSMNP